MEQFNNIHYYTARRNLVYNILEESEKPVTLKELKDLYKQRHATEMPFSDVNEKIAHDWLLNINNVGTEIKNNERIYFVKKSEEPSSTKVIDNNKRKTSSPIVSSTVKRSRSAPDNDDSTCSQISQNTSKTRQARSVKFKDQVSYKGPQKNRSKSEHRPSDIVGAPNMYGSLLIGDDFLLGFAVYKLGFSAFKLKGKLQSGFCASGMTISEATHRIREIEDDRLKTAIIYLGSIDIANGRELIEMMQDFADLMKACGEKNIRPVLCTLAALPNFITGNRKETLDGFNTYLCKNPFGISVIDINKCFRVDNTTSFLPFYYLDSPRYVSGFNKMLLLWSKAGRDRVNEMLMKNLGMALVATGNITFNYI